MTELFLFKGALAKLIYGVRGLNGGTNYTWKVVSSLKGHEKSVEEQVF